MKKDKKLISLKEASELSGYSSDYIGQLIRSGKIFGEQIYSNVVWMTTEEDVLNYRNNSKQKSGKTEDDRKSFFKSFKKRASIELGILKIFLKTFKLAFVSLLVLLFLVIFLFSYIFFILLNNDSNFTTINEEAQRLESLNF